MPCCVFLGYRYLLHARKRSCHVSVFSLPIAQEWLAYTLLLFTLCIHCNLLLFSVEKWVCLVFLNPFHPSIEESFILPCCEATSFFSVKSKVAFWLKCESLFITCILSALLWSNLCISKVLQPSGCPQNRWVNASWNFEAHCNPVFPSHDCTRGNKKASCRYGGERRLFTTVIHNSSMHQQSKQATL